MYTFHEDPGHGWLEVPMAEIDALTGLGQQISTYSYQSRDGLTAYLEEDCDYSRFIEARERAGQVVPRDSIRTAYHEDNRIRNLPQYKKRGPMPPAAWRRPVTLDGTDPDYSGAFDGFTVTSDADGGL